MTTTAPTPASDLPGSDNAVSAGDLHMLAERYEEAAAAYREAIAAGLGGPAVEHKLQRAETAAASAVSRGEQQTPVFRARYAEVAAGESLVPPPHLPKPAANPRPPHDVGDTVRVAVGRAVGTGGSALFHGLTRLAGRGGVSGPIWTNWYTAGESLPGPMRKWYQILRLAYMRETLFENNLVRPYPQGAKTGYVDATLEPPEWAHRWRSADGSWNYLLKDADGRYDPMVGAAYTRFFHNVGDDRGLAGIHPPADPATDPVSVRELSRRLLTTKGERKTVPFLNLWAAAWIQFQNSDWVSHGSNDSTRTAEIPLAEDDPLRSYGIDHLTIHRSDADPTRRPEDEGLPPTFLNEVTHWWDGSQLYGSDWETQQRVRSMEGGRLTVTDDGTLPTDEETGTEVTGFTRNWWVGVGLLHTLFVREHNAIADMLAEHHPDWDDETLFQTARLINAAVMAKIHTVEWTPAILPNHSLNDGMMSNWYGLITNAFGGKHKHVLEDIPITSRELGGIVGNPQGTFAKYGLSEEFTAVYRMHSLLPDVVHVKNLDGTPNDDVPLGRTRHANSPRMIHEYGMESLARTFGEQAPGALVNNNYPASMQDISLPGIGVMDMGSVDLYRDRERGVPTYNQLRREIGLKPIHSFDDLIDDKEAVANLRDLYGTDDQGRDKVDDMDLLIGTLTEAHRPTAFGFGETLFQIFILNASWRLLGDRFYTDDYRSEVYTPEGLAWVDDATFKSVLLRNIPALASTGLANVSNAFEPWDEGRLSEERHPLRACTKGLGPDPWAGDAARQ
ncbi:peroxidase family protein [Humibacillus xanthopallidus]|uniref:Heme peroxidase n=1 Tax=Humibacillus xanthopallidus TaxID=412689 RepID=A0A543HGR0_9MICO|nr:peroxidase family protein [Humibacillus xanthopallidus]TQM57506.1 heme peroxidase [Humibacillus xanthopallidus]